MTGTGRLPRESYAQQSIRPSRAISCFFFEEEEEMNFTFKKNNQKKSVKYVKINPMNVFFLPKGNFESLKAFANQIEKLIPIKRVFKAYFIKGHE